MADLVAGWQRDDEGTMESGRWWFAVAAKLPEVKVVGTQRLGEGKARG